MKNHKIILIGNQGSGKSSIAELIQKLYIAEKTVLFDTRITTLVGNAREIKNKDIELIIFNECSNWRHIKFIYDFCQRIFSPNVDLIFITQYRRIPSDRNFLKINI